jgi:hypothetical protein
MYKGVKMHLSKIGLFKNFFIRSYHPRVIDHYENPQIKMLKM